MGSACKIIIGTAVQNRIILDSSAYWLKKHLPDSLKGFINDYEKKKSIPLEKGGRILMTKLENV